MTKLKLLASLCALGSMFLLTACPMIPNDNRSADVEPKLTDVTASNAEKVLETGVVERRARNRGERVRGGERHEEHGHGAHEGHGREHGGHGGHGSHAANEKGTLLF